MKRKNTMIPMTNWRVMKENSRYNWNNVVYFFDDAIP
jgi:hypothetical protein